MKKLLSMLVSLVLVISFSTSAVYAGNNSWQEKGKYGISDLKGMLKQYYKDKEKSREFIKEIMNMKRKNNDKNIAVFVKGQEVDFEDVSPLIKNGRTLIPVRAVTNALGADVEWNSNDNTVTITKSSTVITLKLGSDVVKVNQSETKIEVPAELIGGRTMVPLRFIAELFKMKVDWDDIGAVIIDDEDDDDEDETSTSVEGTKIEAEKAKLNGGAKKSDDRTEYSGYSGEGYVEGMRNPGAEVTFTVDVPESGKYDVSLRYSNAARSSGTLSIYVNGTRARNTTLLKTANWNTWADKVETLELKEGINVITYKYRSNNNGDANLDYIIVADEIVSSDPITDPEEEEEETTILEAEDADLSNGASVDDTNKGFSGEGYVNGYLKVGAETEFEVDVPRDGKYDVTLRYANATDSARTLSIYVNNKFIRQTELPKLEDWDTWGEETETLELKDGENTIAYKYGSNDNGNVNLDYISIPLAYGMISGSVTSVSGDVDLSDVGTIDWTHWGLGGAAGFNSKEDAEEEISDFSEIGDGDMAWFGDNTVSYSWSDGAPTDSTTKSETAVYLNGEDNGFEITVPAGTEERTLKVYVGAWKAKGKLEAELSDDSDDAYTGYVDSLNGVSCKVFTIKFQAASGDEKLTVRYTVDKVYGDNPANISLQAAALY